jgi:FKBP-type peptidyl-prolyl cis-trans isomerase
MLFGDILSHKVYYYSMQNKELLIIGGAVVVGLGAYFLMGGPNAVPVPDKVAETKSVTVAETTGIEVATATAVTATTTKITQVNTTTKKMTEQNIGGMIIVDEVIGTGTTATEGDTVTVDYVGSLTNGKVFDASKSRGNAGFSFTLGAGEVIKGWDLGVAGMKVGGKRKLTIPADMAYGSQDVGGGLIPANSTLIFEVELLKTSK